MERIILGNAIKALKELPAESVDCCVTSPPYYQLRDYGIAGQIGLEQTVEEYISKLVESGLKVAISEEIKETPIARPEPKKEVKPEQLSLFDLM